MFFNWKDNPEHGNDLVTLYRGEDMHPALAGVFKWAEESAFTLPGGLVKDLILAGGALRSYFSKESVRDYDIYFEDNNSLEQFRARLSYVAVAKQTDSQDSEVYQYGQYNSKTGLGDIRCYNLIKRKFYSCPEDVIRDFDFTVAMCAVTCDKLVFHPDYFVDIQTKTLRLNKINCPLNSLYRLQKYAKLGYEMPPDDLWKIAEAIHDLESLPAVTTDENQTGGILAKDIFRSS